MAVLFWPDGAIVNKKEEISSILDTVGISLDFWPVRASGRTETLLGRETLGEEEKETILAEQDRYFEQLRASHGYTARDLIVIYPGMPGLSGLLDRFLPIHYHEDDEVRYIVDGEGVFGFVLPEGSQVELLVEKGDFIRVPRLLEHWFRLTGQRKVKAVRYFTGTAGWVPVYTGTPSLFSPDASSPA